MGAKRKNLQSHSRFPAPNEIPPQEEATCVHSEKAGLDEQLGVMTLLPALFSSSTGPTSYTTATLQVLLFPGYAIVNLSFKPFLYSFHSQSEPPLY